MVGHMQSELKLKLFLALMLNLWFYIPYCFLQRHRFFSPTEMPPTAFDRLIPFSDKAVWVYCSIFLLMPIGPLLMSRRAELLRYGFGIFLLGSVAYLVFIFWPTWCPRPNAGKTVAAYRMLTAVDKPLNAFPSLHAAFAVFSALCAARQFRQLARHPLWRIVLGFWTLLILLGTLMTKQHMLADIVAGSGLGFAVYICLFGQSNPDLKTKMSLQAVTRNKMRPNSTFL
jgi:membrane-associated phospholipid phosphatase